MVCVDKANTTSLVERCWDRLRGLLAERPREGRRLLDSELEEELDLKRLLDLCWDRRWGPESELEDELDLGGLSTSSGIPGGGELSVELELELLDGSPPAPPAATCGVGGRPMGRGGTKSASDEAVGTCTSGAGATGWGPPSTGPTLRTTSDGTTGARLTPLGTLSLDTDAATLGVGSGRRTRSMGGGDTMSGANSSA